MNDIATLHAVIGLLGTIVGALCVVLVWFLKKERSTVIGMMRSQGHSIDALNTDLDTMRVDVNRVTLAVFGPNGHDGVVSLEHRFRNAMQPIQSSIDSVEERLSNRIEKLTIAIARANPSLRLEDIR